MLRNFKKKFWKYIIPKIAKKLAKNRIEEIDLHREKIFKQFQSVGVNCTLNAANCRIKSPKKIILSNNIHIGNNFFMDGRGGITIANNVHIGENVSIISAFPNYEGNVLPFDQTLKFSPLHIEENVIIDSNVSIMPGVHIGKGAIIGRGAVVNRNIKAYEIVSAPEVKHLRFRNKSHYTKLEKEKRFGDIKGAAMLDLNQNFLTTYKEKREAKIIFILGTGRSGSNAIVNILNQNPNCKAFHEDIRQLIRISTKLAENPNRKEDYFKELEDIFNTKIWQASDNQILIHSDQRLWNLIPFLKEYFPNSKYIHLEREKYSCIKSMYARNWYAQNEYPYLMDHDWAKYRLQANKINVLSDHDWQELDALEKCAWYWNFINKQIENELSQIGEGRVLSLNLKNLERTKAKWSRFISEEDFNYNIVKTNQVKKNHLNKYENMEEEELRNKIDAFLNLSKTY